MLESFIKWVSLIVVAFLAVSPVTYLLQIKGEEEIKKEAEQVLEMISNTLNTLYTSGDEGHIEINWGEGGIPKTIEGRSVEILSHPGHLTLLTDGERIASISVRSYFTFSPPFLSSKMNLSTLHEAQAYIPPQIYSPPLSIIVYVVETRDGKGIFLYNNYALLSSSQRACLFIQIQKYYNELIKDGGGSRLFKCRGDSILGKGFVVFHTHFWIPYSSSQKEDLNIYGVEYSPINILVKEGHFVNHIEKESGEYISLHFYPNFSMDVYAV